MKADIMHDKLLITAEYFLEGQVILETTCNNFDEYKRLPDVVSFRGVVCGKTGWSSDRGYACYKSVAMVADIG